MGLGALGDVSLAEAMGKAFRFQAQIRDGVHPLAARIRCQRRTTRSILVSMGRSLETDSLNFRPSGL
jgi:hypothetical protein